ETTQDQFWKPYDAKPDSFTVYFRVNMGGVTETGDFDPDADIPVGVRGGAPLDPADDWTADISLTREDDSVDGGSFWSGAAYIANSSVSGGEQQSFKFVYDGVNVWESTPDRTFSYSGPKDTTIHWAYFNDQPPTGAVLVEATLTWQVKTDGLEKLGLFDRGLGERIVIDGAKAWNIDDPIVLNYVPILQLWVGEEQFIKAPGSTFEYKAVILWDSTRVDSTSPNFLPGLELGVPIYYYDEPAVTGTGNRVYTYTNQTEQMIPGDYGYDFQYFNALPPEGVIETPISVTFSIDMTPATNVITNPANPLFRPGIDSCEVRIRGCLMGLSQGGGIYSDLLPIKLEDPDANLVYTGTIDLTPPTTFGASYRVFYSSEGGEIENGGGNARGRCYYQFIHPTAVNGDGTVEWPSAFEFPMMVWMDNDLTVEDPPNLWTPTGVSSDAGALIRTFQLAQNYPNPFNPVTTIDYEVPNESHVRISIYNLMGQLVTTLVNEQQDAGTHTAHWNAENATSGVYFLEMTSDSFKQIRKMTLIR
ncbi:T9SS type A sorting domain-containing protein, partial [candidate division KSB1 bacterium]|nr:T9SS type A sorting domain-containing protein [candidate division KSB1 bacterium]